MNFKTKALFFALFISFAPVLAQTDSITVLNTKWEKKKIAKGITLKRYCYNNTLFNSNQNVTILEIKTKGKTKIDLGFERTKLRKTSDYGKSADAIAAINGTFFDIKNGGSVDFLKVNDTVINQNRLLKDSTRARHQQAALVIEDGKLTIEKWDGSKDWEKNLEAETVMLSGPLLLHRNTPELLDSSAFNKASNPRSAIAVIKKNKIAFITVDGRNENANGMSIFELAKVMRWLEYKDAVNLDGGGSTTLWVNNEPGNGVVNYPSDNKKWDQEGERKVANVVMVLRK